MTEAVAADDERSVDDMLAEQVAYYRARSDEYDEWFLRRGRYDRGPDANACWFREVEEVRGALAAEFPVEQVLEFACGTGLWTERLASAAKHVTALDASAGVIALNRVRIDEAARAGRATCRVAYETADLFAWKPARRYDLIFFGFWLSHVPPLRFEAFWRLVASALAPGGRVFFVDNRASSSVARTRRGEVREVRTLNDGREFEIVKIFYEPRELAARLAGEGFTFEVHETGRHFIFGAGALS